MEATREAIDREIAEDCKLHPGWRVFYWKGKPVSERVYFRNWLLSRRPKGK